MRIVLINGSPKVNNSTSGVLLEDVKGYLGENAEVINLGFHSLAISEAVIEELAKADAWVFSCPLYVDGIPGHMLSCLVQLEEVHIHNPHVHVYGIVNCGFYEGVQAELAAAVLKTKVLENNYVSIAYPRFLYKIGAQMSWRRMIKANGGKVKDLKKCWNR